MLGRLVVPLSRLDEVAAVLARSPAPERNWEIAALVGAGDRMESVPAAIGRFHASPGTAGVTVSALEAAPPGVDAVPTQAGDLVTLERFVEVPLDATRDTWLDALTGVGCNAKVRTGGLTADRFPSPASLASLLAACAHRGLPLKATAGLHHAMHGAYRLTYESGSPTGLMHGFLNLLVAALILRTAAGTAADARARARGARSPGVHAGRRRDQLGRPRVHRGCMRRHAHAPAALGGLVLVRRACRGPARAWMVAPGSVSACPPGLKSRRHIGSFRRHIGQDRRHIREFRRYIGKPGRQRR